MKIKKYNASDDSSARLCGDIVLNVGGTTYTVMHAVLDGPGAEAIRVNLKSDYQTVMEKISSTVTEPWETTISNIPHNSDGSLSVTVQFVNLYIYSTTALMGAVKLNTSHAVTADPLPGRYTLTLSAAAHTGGTVKLYSSPYRTAGGNLSNGAYIYNGEKIQVNANPDGGYEATATVNGAAIAISGTWSVTRAASVVIAAKALGNVYIKNVRHMAYIYHDGGWHLYIPYIRVGNTWIMY